MQILKRILDFLPYRDVKWLLTLWLGSMMMFHSYETLFFGGLQDFAAYLKQLGIPFPEFLSPVAKCAEFFGGLALLTGSREVQRAGLFFIAIVMLVATFIAGKGKVWAEAEMPFTFLLIAIVLFFNPATFWRDVPASSESRQKSKWL